MSRNNKKILVPKTRADRRKERKDKENQKRDYLAKRTINPPVTAQKGIMHQFMLGKKKFALGLLGEDESQSLWNELKGLLDAAGPKRSITQWKKTWSDKKKHVRTKVETDETSRLTTEEKEIVKLLTSKEEDKENIERNEENLTELAQETMQKTERKRALEEKNSNACEKLKTSEKVTKPKEEVSSREEQDLKKAIALSKMQQFLDLANSAGVEPAQL